MSLLCRQQLSELASTARYAELYGEWCRDGIPRVSSSPEFATQLHVYSAEALRELEPSSLSPIEAMAHLRAILTAMEAGGRLPDQWMCYALLQAGMLREATYVQCALSKMSTTVALPLLTAVVVVLVIVAAIVVAAIVVVGVVVEVVVVVLVAVR